MQLKNFFDGWANEAGGRYGRKQWMLSKWEVCEGVEWPEEKIELMVETIREGLGLEAGQVVADLGCGGGWIAERLRPYVRGVVGVDFCWDMLSIARQYGPGPWVQGLIGRLPFKDGVFDRVMSYFVFLNFTDDAFIEEAFLDMLRITKRGGLVMVGQLPDHLGSADYDRAKSDYLAYCRSEMRIGPRNDDSSRAPLRTFDREKIGQMLARHHIRHEFRASFNPFYREGCERNVPWRFDLVLFRD